MTQTSEKLEPVPFHYELNQIREMLLERWIEPGGFRYDRKLVAERIDSLLNTRPAPAGMQEALEHLAHPWETAWANDKDRSDIISYVARYAAKALNSAALSAPSAPADQVVDVNKVIPEPTPDALREALKPLAKIADDYERSDRLRDQHLRDEGHEPGRVRQDHEEVYGVNLGHCRRARAALASPPIASEPGMDWKLSPETVEAINTPNLPGNIATIPPIASEPTIGAKVAINGPAVDAHDPHLLTARSSKEPVKIEISWREDGGLRVQSPDEPGLILSGADPTKVMADVLPALEHLREYRKPEWVNVTVENYEALKLGDEVKTESGEVYVIAAFERINGNLCYFADDTTWITHLTAYRRSGAA